MSNEMEGDPTKLPRHAKFQMSPFSLLPNDCKAYIISLTSPKDACTTATLSSCFKSAADSDTVWERFLPSDYRQKISESDTPALNFPTKKQLYFHLCDSGLLLDEGKLVITFNRLPCWVKFDFFVVLVEQSSRWKWTSFPGSRFSQVAQLLLIWYYKITATFSCELLSSNTNYAAYIVFKTAKDSSGLKCPSKASVECAEGINVRNVQLVPPTLMGRGGRSRSRRDGWLELKLGEFFVGFQDRSDVKITLFENEILVQKRGLIVEGIEIRPQELL